MVFDLKLFGVPLAVIFSSFIVIHGFNLETRLPIIKQGHNGSYFGYSVAAHQIRNEHNGSVAESLLLVGAPLDQNLQPKTSKSGALWKCPLTNSLNDCSQVITDGRKDPSKETYSKKKDMDDKDLFPPSENEIKEGQWLGVTVKSQGSGRNVMVCAHRYGINASNDIAGLGMCYILRQNLEFENAYVHCKGRPPDHKGFGVCQAGTSGLIFDDENAIIGAPGSMTWHGALFVFSISEDYLNRNTNVYLGNGTDTGDNVDPNEHIKKDGYMGMSLTAGYFIGDNVTVYVAGAPRANETGQVVLFVKNTDTIGTAFNGYLREYLIIGGEQIASYFGYDVIGADVNGDKLPDLIVAAPFYFNSKTREGGAVYIYMNDPVEHLKNTASIRITGKFETRFGFALASLGDLNKDGYEDIAVGAPYEGNGVVYIYLGSQTGLILKPSQIIRTETLSNVHVPIRTFGYSLSGGMDLDENGYPDLVIGAYDSDTVVLLRARPIIGFVTYIKSLKNLTNIDPNTKSCLVENSAHNTCFQFETCCKINSVVKTFGNRKISINYTLEAETFNNQRKSSRIWFDDHRTKNHRIEKQLNITDTNSVFCQKHVAYLKETTRDIQSPIQIRMSYSLNNVEPDPTKDLLPLDNFPILNQQEADKVFNATFLKNCGFNDVCESELELTANFSLKPLKDLNDERPHHYQMELGEDVKVSMNINIANVKEPAYETRLFVQLPELVNYGKVSILQNERKYTFCTSENSFVICDIANPLKENESVNLAIEMDMEKVNESQPWLDFEVFVNTTSDDEKKNSEPLKLRIKVIARTTLSISGQSIPPDIIEYVNNQVKGESAMVYKEDIGHRVTHEYTIQNNGQWHVSKIDVKIEWPYQVGSSKAQGKWLLYMEERPTVEGSGGVGKCEVDSKNVNPNKLRDKTAIEAGINASTVAPLFPGDKSMPPEKSSASSKGLHNRVKRDIEERIEPEIFTNEKGMKSKVVKMNCPSNTAKCFVIRCTLDSIGSKQFLNIKIKARLWRSTLIEDYADVDNVLIASHAKMHFAQTTVSLQNTYSNEFQVETSVQVKWDANPTAPPVPLYIIIAAIVIGLLLFILLTLLLWKFGFFKRRRPDPTLSGNLEKHKFEEYHDY